MVGDGLITMERVQVIASIGPATRAGCRPKVADPPLGPSALPVGDRRSAQPRLPRHRVGRPDPRRPAPLRAALPGGRAGGALLDHDPAQARRLSARLRGLGSGADRRLRAGGRGAAPGRPGDRAQSGQDRVRHRQCEGLPGPGRCAGRLRPLPVVVRRRSAHPEPMDRDGHGSRRDRCLARPVARPEEARLLVRRPDHRVRLHAVGGAGQRPPGQLLPPRGAVRPRRRASVYSGRMPMPIATIEVPASSANLGSGFDCFAAALSLKLRAELFPATRRESCSTPMARAPPGPMTTLSRTS